MNDGNVMLNGHGYIYLLNKYSFTTTFCLLFWGLGYVLLVVGLWYEMLAIFGSLTFYHRSFKNRQTVMYFECRRICECMLFTCYSFDRMANCVYNLQRISIRV